MSCLAEGSESSGSDEEEGFASEDGEATRPLSGQAPRRASRGQEPASRLDSGADVVRRSSSFLEGVLPGGNGLDRRPTQQELVEQGATQQAAANAVTEDNIAQELRESFWWIVLGFACVTCIAVPVLFGLLVWMIFEYASVLNLKCDVPLPSWVAVLLFMVWYHWALGGYATRLLCCWSYSPETPTMPLRVRIFQLAQSLFHICLLIFGAYLSWSTGTGGPMSTPGLPSCMEVMPGLVIAVRWYTGVGIPLTLIMYLSFFGLLTLMQVLVQNNMLSSQRKAPKGSLERNTTPASEGDPAFIENSACSICFEEFNPRGKKVIVKTNACNHVFHKKCLQGWLNVARTCPLCRGDLGITEEP
eukprot:TRINITY_DN32753_c0_g1_i1.p1 TRINITY_DN32753_c0_g1~~TRINITY_DN32753_c0_g1_i1.p1  ORF type:complete len:359 (-),score=59.67 TRINITY_DN32753_c0_g1_i1:58-1134(-)